MFPVGCQYHVQPPLVPRPLLLIACVLCLLLIVGLRVVRHQSLPRIRSFVVGAVADSAVHDLTTQRLCTISSYSLLCSSWSSMPLRVGVGVHEAADSESVARLTVHERFHVTATLLVAHFHPFLGFNR